MKRFTATVGFLLSWGVFAGQAQEPQGPLTPPPGKEVTQIPLHPNPAPPPLPVEEIIRRFTANEDVFRRAFQGYTYQQTIRVQEFGEDGKLAGEFRVTGEVYIKPNGDHYERIVGQPSSTLRRAKFSVEDVQALVIMPLFPLTADQLNEYTLTYEGSQALDELSTYIFRVQPKRMEHRRRYFTGVVWVDDHDFAVVKSYGQFVIDTPPEGQPLPFNLFEIYRENIDRKYWFPSYTRSDDIVHAGKNDVPVRLTIRSTSFKALPAASGAAGAPPAHSE